MRTALDNISGEHFLLNDEVIQNGLDASRNSPRKRMIMPIHRKQDARVQRMLNFLQPGTYIRPHKHPLPHATESIIVLKGAIRFFIFDDEGNLEHIFIVIDRFAENLIDFEPGLWHSFIVLEEDTILFEIKKGPYDAETDKVFAHWAPGEFSSDSEKFLNVLTHYS